MEGCTSTTFACGNRASKFALMVLAAGELNGAASTGPEGVAGEVVARDPVAGAAGEADFAGVADCVLAGVGVVGGADEA